MQEKSQLALTLIRLRKQKKVTSQTVADAIGIKGTTYRRYEISTEPKLEVLGRIADYFGVSTDYLIGSMQRTVNTDVFVCADGSEYVVGSRRMSLSDDEAKLIELVRSLKESDIEDVISFAEWKKDHS